MGKSSLYCCTLGFFLSTFLSILTPVSAQTSVSGARGRTMPPAPPGIAHDTSGRQPGSRSDKRPLLDVLIELNKTKGAYFLFTQQSLGQILVNNPTSLPNAPVEKILAYILKPSGLHYKKVDDRTFVILRKKEKGQDDRADPVAGLSGASDEQQEPTPVTISNDIVGRVMTADGRTLQGVSITLKGTRKGVSSDLSGAFEIKAGKGDTLIFSFVGYSNKQMTAGEAMNARIIMEPSDKPLTEVLVTALGIPKQERSLGYSASELDGSLFTQSREVNLGNALIGQVAGVSVAENATGPYGSSRVLIRGNASLSGNNQPLYVIDGVPYDNTNQAASGQWGGQDLGDGLSNINPDDIQKVMILKGVAASSLYGYRGGNGAILIETKSGSGTHGIGIQVNNNCSFNVVNDQRDYQYIYGQGVSKIKPTSAQMALAAPYYSWGAQFDGTKAVNFLGNSYAYLAAPDNFKHFFQTGITDQSSVALTGANNKGHFRLGLSDLNLRTIVPNSTMKQQGINLNSTYFVTSKLQMELKADYVFEQVRNRASLSDDPGNVIAPPLYLANSFDIRWMKDHRVNPDGTELLPGSTDPYFENPYYIAYDYQNSTNRNRLTGGLTLRYNALDWLFVQGQLTRDGYIFDVTNIVPSGVQYTRGDGLHGGNMTQYEVNYHEVNGNFMVGVHPNAGPKLSIEMNAGANQQDNVNEIHGIGQVPGSSNRPAGPFQIPGYYSPNNIIIKPYSSYYRHYRVNSIYGSADIGYKNYLFLNLSARNDWFSTLNINTDHYLYPSFSGSFIFSEVWRLPSWISFGKWKASYALSSNGTEPYRNVLTYGLQGYSISGQALGYISTNDMIPNGSLRPVSISEKETGLLMQFLHNRIGFDITYYDKMTTNDIVKVTVSPTAGYTQYIENVGKVRNKGFELLLTGIPIKMPAFSWNLAFNFALNDNKVLSVGKQSSIVIDGALPRWGSEVSISNVAGLPYGQIMGYAYKRDERGNIIYSNGVSNPAPAGEPEQTGVVPLGSTVYKQSGGLTNEFHYKGFSLSLLIDFKFGAKIYSGTNLLLYYYGLHKNTLQGREGGFIGKGVLEDGYPNTIAVPSQQYFQDISASGTDHIAEEFVYDASFIKLRSVSLCYNFPASMLKKKFIKGLSISLTGRNLAILLKHTPNIDPESSINNTNGQGLELAGYPATRSWGFNVNLKF